MNIYIRKIGESRLPSSPSFSKTKMVVEDNIGESIHVHVRNFRIELSIDDYLKFAKCIEESEMRLKDGNN